MYEMPCKNDRIDRMKRKCIKGQQMRTNLNTKMKYSRALAQGRII